MNHPSHAPATDLCTPMAALLPRCHVPHPLALFSRPTPLEAREDIGEALGVRLLMKREDKTDDIGSGHKLRKLSYTAAHAVAQRGTVLVTAGSLPSNQCKAVAALAPRIGMRAHVVYGGDRQRQPAAAHGNYLLTTLCEPTLTWRASTPWLAMPAVLDDVAARERSAGEKPYIVEPGVSNWPGLLGSVELGFEIAQQLAPLLVCECDVVAVAGSGGTCTGLAIAAALMKQPWTVTGICIGEPAAALERRSRALVEAFRTHTGLHPDIGRILAFSDVLLGAGYDAASEREFASVAAAVRRYGLLLDSNYMVKAYLGLFALRRSGELKRRTALLIHSGGQAGIFDAAERWQAWHGHRYRDFLCSQ